MNVEVLVRGRELEISKFRHISTERPGWGKGALLLGVYLELGFHVPSRIPKKKSKGSPVPPNSSSNGRGCCRTLLESLKRSSDSLNSEYDIDVTDSITKEEARIRKSAREARSGENGREGCETQLILESRADATLNSSTAIRESRSGIWDAAQKNQGRATIIV